jgi:hypothetical protein
MKFIKNNFKNLDEIETGEQISKNLAEIEIIL